MNLLNELISVDSKDKIDLFLRQPELKEQEFYYVREGLKSLKKNKKSYPETYCRQYLIINPDEETGYLIRNGLLSKIFRGDELTELSAMREESSYIDVSEPDDKESLDERPIIQKYVHMNRARLKIIPLQKDPFTSGN